MKASIITAPKHYEGQTVTVAYTPLAPNPFTRFSFDVKNVVISLGVNATKIDYGSCPKRFKKEKHIASHGATYLKPYVYQNEFDIHLPKSQKTVTVDSTTFAIIVSFLVWDKVEKQTRQKSYLDYKEQLDLEQVLNFEFALKEELFSGDIHMTDIERQYAQVLKPIVDELLTSL